MSFNRIISKTPVATIVKDGVTIAVTAATETSTWKRTDAMAGQAGGALTNALSSMSGNLPAGTTEVCLREADRRSPADKRDHITAVCFDAQGKGTTVHLPVKKT